VTRYAVSIGSNLGDRVGTLRSAIQALSAFVTNLEISPLYESAPVGGPDQGPFLNAAVGFDSDLSPLDLLHKLQAIENDHGRVRQEHWGPRTLDLDIIVSGADPVNEPPELVIPHPRARERFFVVAPMMSIWPEAELSPGLCFDDVYAGVSDQDVDLVARTWVDGFGSRGRLLVGAQILLFLVIGLLLVVTGTVPDGAGPTVIAGSVLALAGLILMWFSVKALGRNLVAVPEPIVGGSLVETGPYQRMRHPIYAAIFMIFAGVSVVFRSWPAGAVTIILYLLFSWKSHYEEGLLRIAYPEYWGYMKRVKYRMPGIA
jgi:2-amino-4-hydroxy-6-hydroxymethyldihydropteridine diphosphokinase